MHYSYLIPAAFAVSVLAVPMPQNVVYDVVTDISYVTEVVDVYAQASSVPAANGNYGVSSASPSPVQSWSHHGHKSHSHPAATPTVTIAATTAAYTPPAAVVTTYAPAPAPAQPVKASATSAAPAAANTYASDIPVSGGVSILETMNKWRAAYGLALFTWDDQLAANALKTGTDDQGVNEVHELNAGSMCQVITPGFETVQSGRNMDGLTPFEMGYLGGWLCEVPSASALGGNCATWASLAGMDFPASETGHADILTGTDLKIGCAFAPNSKVDQSTAEWTGLWVCDLA